MIDYLLYSVFICQTASNLEWWSGCSVKVVQLSETSPDQNPVISMNMILWCSSSCCHKGNDNILATGKHPSNCLWHWICMYNCAVCIICLCWGLYASVTIQWIIIVQVINRSVWGEACDRGVCLSWPALYPTLAGTWSWQVSGWITGGHSLFHIKVKGAAIKINIQQLKSVFEPQFPFKCEISVVVSP